MIGLNIAKRASRARHSLQHGPKRFSFLSVGIEGLVIAERRASAMRQRAAARAACKGVPCASWQQGVNGARALARGVKLRFAPPPIFVPAATRGGIKRGCDCESPLLRGNGGADCTRGVSLDRRRPRRAAQRAQIISNNKEVPP